MKTPQFTCEMKAPGKVKLEIYDDIGPGWLGMIDAKMVSEALAEFGDAEEIDVHFNSRGGSAYEGLAMASLLRDHPAKVSGHVDGICASAATLPAMACDTLRIPKNALLMIHDPATFAFGGEDDMTKALSMLKSVKKAGVELYVVKSKKSAEEVAAIMKAETWYTGEEAVAAGFADSTEKAIPKDKAPVKEKASQSYREAPWNLMPTVSLSLPKEPVMAEPIVKPEAPATPPAVPAAPAPAPVVQVVPPAPVTDAKPQAAGAVVPAQLTAADVAKAATDAAQKALDGERSRAAEINALCALAGKPEMATKYIGDGTSVVDAQKAMYEVVCKDRRPVDDPPGANPVAGGDENAKYKAEYAKQKKAYMAAGLSEDEYIASRRVDDELDNLTPKPPKPAAKAAA